MQQRLKGSMTYMLGPMEFAKDNGANWRIKATEFLKKLDIGCLNPVNKPCEHAPEDEQSKIERKKLKESYRFDEFSTIMKEIVSIDLRLCDKCDFGLMYFNRNIFTCGTFVEYAHLNIQRKPVVIWTDDGLENISDWLFGQTNWKLMHSSLDEALEYIRHIHQDEKIDRLNRWKFFNNSKIFS